MSRPRPRFRKIGFLHPRHAIGRIAIALSLGAISGLLLSLRYPAALAVVGGWDVGALALLFFAWQTIAHSDASATRQRAAAEDPGRTAVNLISILTSGASFLAAIVMVGGVRGIPSGASRELIALCLTTVALSWTLTHVAFTLRYAHLYYREDAEGIGGVDFPGRSAPRYLDFAYLAFTVGMCFQVSDVTVSSPQIRRAVLLHATLSFFYNTAILAFVLNLIFGIAA